MIFEPVLVPVARARDPLVRARRRVFYYRITVLRFIDSWIGPRTIFVHNAVKRKRRKLNILRLLNTFRRRLVERTVAVDATRHHAIVRTNGHIQQVHHLRVVRVQRPPVEPTTPLVRFGRARGGPADQLRRPDGRPDERRRALVRRVDQQLRLRVDDDVATSEKILQVVALCLYEFVRSNRLGVVQQEARRVGDDLVVVGAARRPQRVDLLALFQPPRFSRVEQPRVVEVMRAVVAPEHDKHGAEARAVVIHRASTIAHVQNHAHVCAWCGYYRRQWYE
mmetsp:Transcript_25369/g.65950  ORF Transcript_25369/g.65950 Transcript_25369/m.65950 type:complete len:279 (-) Transcript_25369:1568-2404(-)